MDIQAVVQAISTLGFPIAACAWLLWSGKRREDREAVRNDKFAELLTDHKLALNELSALNRAELNNQDKLKSDMSAIRESIIRMEQRPCQKEG